MGYLSVYRNGSGAWKEGLDESGRIKVTNVKEVFEVTGLGTPGWLI